MCTGCSKLFLLMAPIGLFFFWWQFFVCFNRERLHNFCESASKKPLISLVGGIVRDYQPLWESVYFYSKPLFF